jgi:hypothetical protein
MDFIEILEEKVSLFIWSFFGMCFGKWGGGERERFLMDGFE